jgi:hypothetical protein
MTAWRRARKSARVATAVHRHVVKLPQRTVCIAGQQSHEDCHMFQIIRLALDDQGAVVGRRPLQPLFELREDAMAMAEFDASRLWGDYGRDEERDCWWGTDALGRKYRFVVESGASADIAA